MIVLSSIELLWYDYGSSYDQLHFIVITRVFYAATKSSSSRHWFTLNFIALLLTVEDDPRTFPEKAYLKAFCHYSWVVNELRGLHFSPKRPNHANPEHDTTNRTFVHDISYVWYDIWCLIGIWGDNTRHVKFKLLQFLSSLSNKVDHTRLPMHGIGLRTSKKAIQTSNHPDQTEKWR